MYVANMPLPTCEMIRVKGPFGRNLTKKLDLVPKRGLIVGLEEYFKNYSLKLSYR